MFFVILAVPKYNFSAYSLFANFYYLLFSLKTGSEGLNLNDTEAPCILHNQGAY